MNTILPSGVKKIYIFIVPPGVKRPGKNTTVDRAWERQMQSYAEEDHDNNCR